MHTVMLADNPLDSGSYHSHEVEHVGEFLCQHFEARWPETARIYKGSVAKENDVTPGDEEQIEALERYDLIWVIVYPATGVEVAIAIGVVALAASIAAILLIPNPPKTAKEKTQLTGSPNNNLTDRSNVARPGQRIPDLFGLVKSVPDKVMVTYITYVNHRQTEIGLYCIGRGDHDVTVDHVRDGSTRIDQIDQASAHVYSPGNAPTGVGPFSGDILAIGDPIDDPAMNVYQIQAVNGQAMEPLNSKKLYGAAKKPDVDGSYNTTTVYNFFNIMAFEYVSSTTGKIHVPFLQSTQYVHDRVKVGDLLYTRFDPADIPTTGTPKPNLQTDRDEPFAPTAFVVTSITDAGDYVELGISVPSLLLSDWAAIPAYVASLSGVGNQAVRFGTSFDAPYCEIVSVSNLYVGPFFVDFLHPPGSSNISVSVNFVAPSGSWIDDGKSIQGYDLTFGVGITPCDSTGTPTGGEAFFSPTLLGSDRKDGTRAVSFRQLLGINSRFLIRARRTTNRLRREELPTFVEAKLYPDLFNIPNGQRAFTGTIQDEVRWTQAYTMSEPPNISFGDVTLVHTRTVNTDGATQNQDRNLNLLVQRKIATWNGTAFTGPLVANADAENVLFTLMKDQFIGNRSNAEIDFAGISACFDTIRHYFNDSNTGQLATLVSLTLDDDSVSFEETVISIATMAFAVLYRLGNVIKAKPDIATPIASLVFNHRNILPGTQKIEHTFGPPTENDSVQVDYVDPNDSTITQVIVPFNGTQNSTVNAKIIGLGTRVQAIWHAYRAYQKILFQRQALEMQATSEAVTAIVKDRVLIADVTQFQPQSGEVVQVSGLNLKLSQKPTFTFGKTYTIFLMHLDNVEGIPITAASGFFDVVLGSAPSSAIITDPSIGVPTIYNIVQNDDAMPSAWLVSEMTAEDNMHINVQAINYSDLYYFADSLDTWLKDRVQDYSAFERPLTSDHSVSQITVAPRGTMLDMDGSNFITYGISNPGILDLVYGYTFFAWIKHISQPGLLVGIIETAGTPEVLFGFQNDVLTGFHQSGSPVVSDSSVASGVLHSVAMTYDPVAARVALFRNGLLVSAATGVAALTTPLSFNYGRIFLGQMGDVMRWKRCWSDRSIFELHTKTLIL